MNTSGREPSTTDSRLAGGLRSVAPVRVFAAALGFAIPLIAARLLSPDELGVFFLLLSAIAVFTVLFAVGIPESGLREIAGAIGEGDRRQAMRDTAVTLILGSCLSVLAFAVFMGVGYWAITWLFDSPAITGVAVGVGIWLGAGVLARVIALVLKGYSRFAWSEALLDGISGGLLQRSLVLVALAGLLVLDWDATLALVTLIGAVATLATVGVGFLVLRGSFSFRFGGSYGGLWSRARFLFRVGVPVMLTGLVILVWQQADLWILGAMSTEADVAAYGAAIRLVALVSLPLVVVNGVVPPIISDLTRAGQTVELESSLRSATTAAALVSGIGVLLFIVLGGQMLGIFFGPFYSQAAPVLVWLGLGALVSVWAGPCGLVLMLSGYERDLLVITTAVLTLGFLAGIGMLAVAGATGLAAAIAVSRAAHNVAMAYWVRRRMGLTTWMYASPREVRRALGNVIG